MKSPLDRDAETFGDWAYLAIAKHYNKILHHEAGVLKDQDPEELHEMRVGIRRLRSAIAGFGAALQLPEEVSEKKVGQIGKKLGALRDFDVLQITLIDHHLPQLPATEQAHFKSGLKQLSDQRQQAFKSTQKLLKSDRYQNFKTTLEQWLAKPDYQAIATVPILHILPDLLLPQVSQLLLHPGWWLGAEIRDRQVTLPDSFTSESVDHFLLEQGEILHDLRKTAKRSRYTLELFSQFYDESYATYLKQIKSVQSILGDFQDSRVLAEFIENSFQTHWQKSLPQFAQDLSDLRFQRWQDWQNLQQQFLALDFRQSFHTTLLQPKLNPLDAQLAIAGLD